MNQEEEEIVVKNNYTTSFLHLLGCIIFVFLAYYLFNNYEHFNSRKDSPMFVKFISIIGILFFGYIGFFRLLELIKFGPALIISKSGIRNNTTPGKSETIPWNEIKSIRLTKVSNQKFISIEVKNPKELIKNANIFRRIIMSLNYKFYGTPIYITTNTLDQSGETIVKLLKAKKKEYS